MLLQSLTSRISLWREKALSNAALKLAALTAAENIKSENENDNQVTVTLQTSAESVKRSRKSGRFLANDLTFRTLAEILKERSPHAD